MWHVDVINRATGGRVARYSYPTKREASEAARNVKEVRLQNRERVKVIVTKESDK